MGAVHVRVGHDNGLAVAELLEREPTVLLAILVVSARPAHPGTQCRDDGAYLLVVEDLVDPGLEHVQDLAAQRQNRLVAPVAPHLRRPARRVTLDQVDLAQLRVGDGAVRELPRQSAPLEHRLPPGEVARLPRGHPRLRRRHGLRYYLPRDRRRLLEELLEPLPRDRCDQPLDLAVAQLRLRLPLELRLLDLDTDDRRESFETVVAGHRLPVLPEQVVFLAVAVDGPGQCLFEAGQVGAALDRVDVVRVGVDARAVRVVVLKCDLDRRAVSLTIEVHDLLVKHGAVLVHELHELAQPALVAELALLACPVVGHDDREPRVQERELPTPRPHYLEIELGLFEDLGVRQERRLVPALLSLTGRLDLPLRNAPRVTLRVDDAVARDLDLAPLRERIHDRDTNTVQPAGDLVTGFVELAARVQYGHHDFESRLLLCRVPVDRDAATVVLDRDAAVLVEHHCDLVAEAGHRLVDRVIDHLVDQVMETAPAGVANVHGGAFPHRLEALQNLNVLRVVGLVVLGGDGESVNDDVVDRFRRALRRRFRLRSLGHGLLRRRLLRGRSLPFHRASARLARGLAGPGRPCGLLRDLLGRSLLRFRRRGPRHGFLRRRLRRTRRLLRGLGLPGVLLLRLRHRLLLCCCDRRRHVVSLPQVRSECCLSPSDRFGR